MLRRLVLVSVAGLAALPGPALAQGTCPNRGELDELYCDANKDMVADAPTDPTKLRDPSTIVFTYTPVEDPAVYENIFKPFTDHLGQCTGKKVVFYQVQSNAAEIEAMRSGRLHVGGFSTGPTGFAVNMAGAVPFAVKGTEKVPGLQPDRHRQGDSPYQKLADLKGKKVAHTSPSSNSGHLAPLALFPEQGLSPDKDYKIMFSGGHDKSVLGVDSGDYDAAAVASDVFHRMAARGRSRKTTSASSTQPEIPDLVVRVCARSRAEARDKMQKCFYDYRFPPEMQKAFDGADRFFPITYKKDWAIVRKVAEDSGNALQQGGVREGGGARGRGGAQEGRGTDEAMTAAPAVVAATGEGDRAALLIRDLRKEYRPGKPVLHGHRPRDPARGITAIIGPSGTGKSTLIRCINRLVEPTAGEILFRGQDLAQLSGCALRQARRQIGMVFQEYNLVERLTVMENLLCGRLGYVSPWRAWLRQFPAGDIERGVRLLDAVGLAGFANRRADALSGGQRQRVGIARAVMQQPDSCWPTSRRRRSIRRPRSRSWSCWRGIAGARGIPVHRQHARRRARAALRRSHRRHAGGAAWSTTARRTG